MYATISLQTVCSWFGISRQSYYQQERHTTEQSFDQGLLLEEIKSIRRRHQRIGVRKLQSLLGPFMQAHAIKMGRDAMFDFLSYHGLLVRKRKRHVKTTYSYQWQRKYPNLITDFIPSRPNELWVSDITYWKLCDQAVYLSLITDAYSRKIVGYHLSEDLSTAQSIKALNMALSGIGNRTAVSDQLIHHSDRGTQYCSSTYVSLLQKHHIQISMTQSGDPLENAIAERVNGIIKDEYLLNYPCRDLANARKYLKKAVSLYNTERPHSSIGNLTPEFVHNQYHLIKDEKIKRMWKNYYKKKSIFANQLQD